MQAIRSEVPILEDRRSRPMLRIGARIAAILGVRIKLPKNARIENAKASLAEVRGQFRNCFWGRRETLAGGAGGSQNPKQASDA